MWFLSEVGSSLLGGLLVSKAKMVTGVVKWFNPRRKYGFIERSDGKEDVFVHLNDVADSTWLQDQDRVEFFVVESPKGPRAIAVRHLQDNPRRAAQKGTRQPSRARVETRMGRSSFSYTIYPQGYASARHDFFAGPARPTDPHNQE
jgi:CspA family cold shock protein